MKQENIDFLEANREYWDIYQRAQYVKHLDNATRQRLFDIIREEFAPNFITNLWCSSCVVDILKFAYTQFDKWKEANPVESVKDVLIDKLNADQAKEHDIIMNGDPAKAEPMPGMISIIDEAMKGAMIMSQPKAKRKRRNNNG